MKKKILIIPSRFPTDYQPHNYIFVEEQAKALSAYVDVFVIGGIPVSLKFFFKKSIKLFSRREVNEGRYHLRLFLYPALPKLKIFNEFVRLIINKVLVKSALAKGDAHLVHFHSYLSASVGPWIKEKYNIPYLITEHSSQFYKYNLSKYDKRTACNVFRKSNVNIAVSKSLSVALKSSLNIDSIYVPNMVNTIYFDPALPFISNEIKIYLTIGNLVEVKNQELLIRAFCVFFAKNNKSILQIIGQGEELENLRRVIRELNMEDHIQLLGYKDRPAIKNYLEKADFFVLSSHQETFGVVVIEALSMGLPVLMTDFGGVSVEIAHYEGCIVVNNTEEALAEGLEDIQWFSKNSDLRRIALDNYSSEVICSKLLDVYARI